MLINLFNFIIHNFMFFTGAYSNNAFPEPLSKEEEEEYIDLVPILENLFFDVDDFLKPIQKVRIEYV